MKTELNPEGLSTTQLLTRSLGDHLKTEGGILGLARRLNDPGNGRALHLPTGEVQILGVSQTEINRAIISGLLAILQDLRFLHLVLEQLAARIESPLTPPSQER